jgi:galactokinase
MPPLIYQRCLHVVAENQRVMDAVKALGSNDLSRFGELMAGSHRSLRDLYQVSCPELDIMVGLAKDLAGCYGARMTGGGFGGCTVNLVRDTDADAFSAKIAAAYKQKTGIHPDVYICTAADGAHAES